MAKAARCQVKHRAEISHREGVSRALVTQIMDLLKLHTSILDYVRSLGPETPERMVTERKLRGRARLLRKEQQDAAKFVLRGFSEFCQR